MLVLFNFVLLWIPLAAAFTLSCPSLSVTLDDVFPRPLSYTLSSTGETLFGALTGYGFHLSLSLNRGQATCGEASISTVYSSPPDAPATALFVTTAACALNWGAAASTTLTLVLNGTVSARADAAVPGASVFTLVFSDAQLMGAGAPPLTTLDVAGLELLSFHPPPNVTSCMYTATDNGAIPRCGGDWYFCDAWSNAGLDEWYSFTYDQSWVLGQVDINTAAGSNPACMDGASSRLSPGPLSSVFAGGWSASQRTGAAVLSSEKHAPFWTGLRAHDAPGRCSTFTIAPATLHVGYVCGSGLPIQFDVGVFSNLTGAVVGGDDLALWRRGQFPRADVLYRTSLPYKIQVDMTSYCPTCARLPFARVLEYVRNISLITDGYPQTPILVGWQGLGHDTLYPAIDVINIHPDIGGAAGLAALYAGLANASGSLASSVSFHVNSDESYALFNGTANREFDWSMCRTNVDHASPWFMNCSVDGQTPDCGARCSISKTKDAVFFGRYDRLERFFTAIHPQGLRTIHSDAWRDVGASWEPATDGGAASGFIDCANEQRCGQQGDVSFWASHGVSMGGEGNDGQAAELMGSMSFLYHNGAAWDTVQWGRIVSGTALGWDLDVTCQNPGGRCSWDDMADNFWLLAKIYQLALTEELLGTTSGGWHVFSNGGRVHRSLTAVGRAAPISAVPHPATWTFGGDAIPIANAHGGVLVPLVETDGMTLSPNVLHAYQSSKGAGPPYDSGCPLFSPTSYASADNTAVGNYGDADSWVTYDAALPPAQAASRCSAACAAAPTCAAWDVIKVTPSSGKAAPVCGLFIKTAPVGCRADVNQWAGARGAPLPIPPDPDATSQVWTLPLSWGGRTVTATELTPNGPVTGRVGVAVVGRNLTLSGITPSWAVRLEVA